MPFVVKKILIRITDAVWYKQMGRDGCLLIEYRQIFYFDKYGPVESNPPSSVSIAVPTDVYENRDEAGARKELQEHFLFNVHNLDTFKIR